MVHVGKRREADAATKTAGRREKIHLGETDRAGAIGGGRIGRKPAEGTFGREKEIQNRPPERGCAHILAGN